MLSFYFLSLRVSSRLTYIRIEPLFLNLPIISSTIAFFSFIILPPSLYRSLFAGIETYLLGLVRNNFLLILPDVLKAIFLKLFDRFLSSVCFAYLKSLRLLDEERCDRVFESYSYWSSMLAEPTLLKWNWLLMNVLKF